MLTHLSIQNFALIQNLSLDFTTGLVIFTGETGAGKSIIIDALALALGKRSEASVIREGSDKCDITAIFDVTHHPAAARWLHTQDLLRQEGCILRRSITRDGRSKSFINGVPIPLQLLRELGFMLVTLHGQHDHQHLLQTEGQRQLLDNFGQLTPLRREVKACYQHFCDLKKKLEEDQTAHQHLLAQKEFLLFQTQELSALALQAHEVEKLEKDQKRLAYRHELVEGMQTIIQTLDEDERAITAALQNITNKLAHFIEYDEKLLPAYKLLESAAIQAKEAASELHHFIQNAESDPQQLEKINDQLTHIYDLARKHHVGPNELFSLHRAFLEKLSALETHSLEMHARETEIQTALSYYQEKATLLSFKRKETAKKLTTLITKYMQKLGMKGGKFEVILQANPDNLPTASGLEKIEFWVSTNPGSSLQPLAKVASGGELSRLSLALIVVGLSNELKMTLIFDEIDTGIGGATAACVGELLKQLGNQHQIFCITHAPQVAVFSQQHYVVTKKPFKNKTVISIQELIAEEKIQEIARMLGGTQITASTLQHAKEMVTLTTL